MDEMAVFASGPSFNGELNDGTFKYTFAWVGTIYCAGLIEDKKGKLTNLEFPNIVTLEVNGRNYTYEINKILDEAFFKDTQIETVYLPNKLRAIGQRAFLGCKKLTTINFPESLSAIAVDAFYGCEELGEMITHTDTLGKESYKLHYVNDWLVDCTIINTKKPQTIIVKENTIATSNYIFKYTQTPETQNVGIKSNNIYEIQLPESLTKIGFGMCQGLSSLTKINIPNQVKEITAYAFDRCTKITSLILPSEISTIGENAFNGCEINLIYSFPLNLTNYNSCQINFPYGAKSITVSLDNYFGTEDFLGFTFNGKHSFRDLSVLRVINGDRFTEDLAPQMNDLTADVPGTDGQYFFGTTHKSRNFSIEVAFDNLSETDFRKWRQFCNGKELGDLIFDENPYKVYKAKITGTPQLKYICFDKDGQRVYKGEGTIQFTAYWPYAHTPNSETQNPMFVGGTFGVDGRDLANYLDILYPTKNQWVGASGLIDNPQVGDNPGDLPAPFVLTKTGTTTASSTSPVTFRVGDCSITLTNNVHNLKWDSKTGIVSGTAASAATSDRKPVAYTGESLGAIPVGGTTELELNGGTLEYDYWYY